jgi:hypothetical protein
MTFWVCKAIDLKLNNGKLLESSHGGNHMFDPCIAHQRIKITRDQSLRWSRWLNFLVTMSCFATKHFFDCLKVNTNCFENTIRLIALGKKNWLFACSQRAGKRAAVAMSLIQSVKMNGLDPYAYIKDIVERLPTHKNHLIYELLPHNWKPRT